MPVTPSHDRESPPSEAPRSRGARTALSIGGALRRFARLEAASGIVLVVAAIVAMLWANGNETYRRVWRAPLALHLPGVSFAPTLAWFVNDVSMVFFFFVVAMELRGELQYGVFSHWRRVAVPAVAALGGMLAPAIVYLVIARGPGLSAGWGVPMATDIAFAVGVLGLLGRRVPSALRVLLLAVAVIDDLGAIVVIAVFYSSQVRVAGLAVAALACAGIWLLQRRGVRARRAYVLPAVVVWAGIFAAGVHPTIAGVVLGLMTPVHASVDPRDGETLSPSKQLTVLLQPWVAFAVMPIFALANAGVRVSGETLTGTSWAVTLGIAAGLALGKPLGVLGAIAVATKLGLGTLPHPLTRRHLVILGVVAGIGFTMALFIAQLGFTDESLLSAAKGGVLAGSTVSALLALVLGRLLLWDDARDAATGGGVKA